MKMNDYDICQNCDAEFGLHNSETLQCPIIGEPAWSSLVFKRTTPNDQVYAFPFEVDSYISGGLTKREYFAGLAMQGLLANPSSGGNLNDISNWSVVYADSLIERLAEEKK